MSKKQYYSIRTGKNPLSRIDLVLAKQLFSNFFDKFEGDGYFQQSFGYHCVDNGHIYGSIGHDLESVILLELRKSGLTPISTKIKKYTEDDLFDIIEFLFDQSSKPIDGYFHDFSNCGRHYNSFDKSAGQIEFRDSMNRILNIYNEGYELSSDGEILFLPEEGHSSLYKAPIPSTDKENIISRMNRASTKFRGYRTTLAERRDAIRELADVLEFLKPKIEKVLTRKDESDLFNLANNFHIRHHNKDQKTQYDEAIWYSWMFHYYLATLHAVLRLIEKSKTEKKAPLR